MKSTLSVKQHSMLTYFCDAAEIAAKVAPNKINRICNLTLSSRQNTNNEFHQIVSDFIDCNAEQIKEKCEKLRIRLT